MRPRVCFYSWRRMVCLNLVVAGCLLGTLSFAAPAASAAEDRLVLLTAHWEGIRTEFTRAFKDWHRERTGRDVMMDWRDVGGASDAMRYILSEFRTSKESIGIDLFFGGGLDPYLELDQKGLLQACPLPDEVWKGIPSDLAGLPLYHSKGHWFGAAISSFGILCNDRVIRQMGLPPVKTWRDLADPRLKGWVGSGDPRNSGANHMIYECILQSYGWDEGWRVIQGMGANIGQYDRAGSTAAKSCTLGNVACSVVIDFYGLMQVAEGGSENMSLVIPSAESVFNPDCIAMLKGAPHGKTAELFMEFVMSDAGQSLWLAPVGHPSGAKKFAIPRMAMRPKLYETFVDVTPVKVNPFKDLKPMSYRASLGSQRWSPLNALLGAVVIDRPPAERAGVKIPVTEDELSAIAKKDWKDPVRRTRLVLAWQQGR
ncbi:MAG: extracellular solute-binding protein [Verrucomicrobiae bacterium]|nr:extracellular solute-binding protein [Verrucomicrobiae bacterium]